MSGPHVEDPTLSPTPGACRSCNSISRHGSTVCGNCGVPLDAEPPRVLEAEVRIDGWRIEGDRAWRIGPGGNVEEDTADEVMVRNLLRRAARVVPIVLPGPAVSWRCSTQTWSMLMRSRAWAQTYLSSPPTELFGIRVVVDGSPELHLRVDLDEVNHR